MVEITAVTALRRVPSVVSAATRSQVLRMVDVNVAADDPGNGGQVAFIRTDDEVAATEGPFNDASVDDVCGPGTPGQGAGGPGPGVIESFNIASGQQPGELRLARRAPPALGNNGGGHGRYDTAQ